VQLTDKQLSFHLSQWHLLSKGEKKISLAIMRTRWTRFIEACKTAQDEADGGGAAPNFYKLAQDVLLAEAAASRAAAAAAAATMLRSGAKAGASTRPTCANDGAGPAVGDGEFVSPPGRKRNGGEESGGGLSPKRKHSIS
jgi:hypothetical protein